MDDALAATFAAMNKRLERIAVELHESNEQMSQFIASLDAALQATEQLPKRRG